MFISLISRGNMFQKVGPETRNLRRPKVIVLVRGMTKSPRAADLKLNILRLNPQTQRDVMAQRLACRAEDREVPGSSPTQD